MKKPSEILVEIVDLLTPLDSEERRRIVKASLLVLGESTAAAEPSDVLKNPSMDGNSSAWSSRLQLWSKQHSVSAAQLEQVLHITPEGAELIAAEIPGRSESDKTINAYVLSGLPGLASASDPVFTDKSARALCESAGCYDSTNHSKYMKNKGNLFSGSKEKGWTLTGPGLKRAAELVKLIAGEQNES